MTTTARQIRAAVAFADVSNSTMLYERLGDERARLAVAECVAIMCDATAGFDGVVIKTIGDEVMAAFRTADDAIAALVRMQEEITDRKSVEGVSLMIRAGFNFGPVLFQDGDLFGDAVNTAARLAGEAKRGQIMTTGETVDQLSPAWREAARQVDLSTVRGKRDPIALFEIVREREEATRVIAAASPQMTGGGRMILRLGGEEVAVDAANAIVELGRGEGNDLVVRRDHVSRLHARVECRRGRFVLVDHSVNGTYVHFPGAEGAEGALENRVRRDELHLEGAGVIGLGRAVLDGDPEAIHFTTAG